MSYFHPDHITGALKHTSKPDAPTMHPRCTHDAPKNHSRCITNTQIVEHEPSTTTQTWMHPRCTQDAPTMHPFSQIVEQAMHPRCTHDAPTNHSRCITNSSFSVHLSSWLLRQHLRARVTQTNRTFLLRVLPLPTFLFSLTRFAFPSWQKTFPLLM